MGYITDSVTFSSKKRLIERSYSCGQSDSDGAIKSPDIAIPKLEAILSEYPLLVDARLSLSLKYTEAGQLDLALAGVRSFLILIQCRPLF